MKKIDWGLFFALFLMLFSLNAIAAPLTMNDLAGTWNIKKRIIENGDEPLDASGNLSGKKEIRDGICEITPINTASGYLKCADRYFDPDDEIFQIDIVKKKLILTPLTYAPYNGFKKTLALSWSMERINRYFDDRMRYSDPELSGPIYWSKMSPLKIVNQNKLINGAIRLEADFTGKKCYTFKGASLYCSLEKGSLFTETAVYEVKYLSLTR